MQILTPSGYRDIAACAIGDEVSAFDLAGAPIINTIEALQWVDAEEWARWWSVEPAAPPFQFFRINGTWTINSEQSIWRNGGSVCHAKHLVVGDVVYDGSDHDITISSIEEVITDGWWRFDISGDHSYIIDGLTLHNASRFWVSGTGTWDASTTTHWGSASGTADSSSVPGSADAVTFDGSSGGGTCTVNTTITVQSITMGAFASGTLDFSVNNNNATLSAGIGFNCNGTATRTLKMGNGTWTLTTTVSTGASTWNMGGTTNLTFQANSSTIVFSGANTGGAGGRQFVTSSASLTFNNLTLSGAGNYTLSCGANITFNTLSIGGQANVILSQGVTHTCTSIATTSISSTPASMGSNNSGSQYTISIASGTKNISNIAVKDGAFTGGATFTANPAYDLGNNTGITFTAPGSGGGGGVGVIGS